MCFIAEASRLVEEPHGPHADQQLVRPVEAYGIGHIHFEGQELVAIAGQHLAVDPHFAVARNRFKVQ